jgi:NitT/TauT family transport system ATP-binding protein
MDRVYLERIEKSFGSCQIFDGLSCTIEPGKTTGLFGPNGCGKSTLLYLIAGLEAPDFGKVHVENGDGKRPRFGLVLQQCQESLFPWLSVKGNLLLASRASRVSEPEKIVDILLKKWKLTERSDANPLTLCGGESQRVSLARALAMEPTTLLLDEPFGSLDYLTRMAILKDASDCDIFTGRTTVLVGHHVEDLLLVADRVLVFNRTASSITELADEVIIDIPRHERQLSCRALELACLRMSILKLAGFET